MSIGTDKIQPYLELTTFNIGDVCCGINILSVQEINKLIQVTPVPLASEYVKGILNLRGQIITVMDVGTRLGLPSQCEIRHQRNIIVRCKNESIGLLVDSIGDVFRTEMKNIEKPPANVVGLQGQFFEGVLKTDKQLISILNLTALLG
ncbi:MAG: chemotaxis protein CheW [Saprospiraceae bacterium]|nr:chemotaxis protein CheW [Saprospiraceae bacterium]